MRLALTALLAACLAPAATGSISVADDASAPSLRVDAAGNVQVAWSAAGVGHTLLVPVHGRVLPNGRFSGADVSHAGSPAAVPFARVVRSVRSGWTYALESWQVVPGGPVELHFARWRGAPTAATLVATRTSTGVLLSGSATFGGRPVPTISQTTAGKRLRQYAYVDAFRAGHWRRIGGVATKPDGTFRRLVPDGAAGSRYRVLVPGPNIGSTYAPDAIATASPGP